MNLSQSLNEALNEQILQEYGNMLLYKKLESFFEDLQLSNIAAYFKKQAQEEKEHGDKIVEHINERTGGKVVCGDAFLPETEDLSLENVGRIFVETEEATTESLEEICDLIYGEKSYMDVGFILSMLNEQVEEEDSANKFSMNLSMCKDIVLFDKSFGE